jgi:hypothetical protein
MLMSLQSSHKLLKAKVRVSNAFPGLIAFTMPRRTVTLVD